MCFSTALQVIVYDWSEISFGSTSRILDEIMSLAITKGWENNPIADIHKSFNLSAVQFPFKRNTWFTELPLKVMTKYGQSARRVAEGSSTLIGSNAFGSFEGGYLEIVVEPTLDAQSIDMVITDTRKSNVSYHSEWNKGNKCCGDLKQTTFLGWCSKTAVVLMAIVTKVGVAHCAMNRSKQVCIVSSFLILNRLNVT